MTTPEDFVNKLLIGDFPRNPESKPLVDLTDKDIAFKEYKSREDMPEMPPDTNIVESTLFQTPATFHDQALRLEQIQAKAFHKWITIVQQTPQNAPIILKLHLFKGFLLFRKAMEMSYDMFMAGDLDLEIFEHIMSTLDEI
jgi:hypothetical protein